MAIWMTNKTVKSIKGLYRVSSKGNKCEAKDLTEHLIKLITDSNILMSNNRQGILSKWADKGYNIFETNAVFVRLGAVVKIKPITNKSTQKRKWYFAVVKDIDDLYIADAVFCKYLDREIEIKEKIISPITLATKMRKIISKINRNTSESYDKYNKNKFFFMKRTNKLALYESIMRKVSKVVKNAINESREIKLYSFDELSDVAKKNAIKNLQSTAAEWLSETDWNDIRETFDRFEDMSNGRMDFVESSRYPFNVVFKWEGYDDKSAYHNFIEKINDFKPMLWSDNYLVNIAKRKKLFKGDYIEYIENVANDLLKQTNDTMKDYYHDESIAENYIECNFDLEFYEDGKPYNS